LVQRTFPPNLRANTVVSSANASLDKSDRIAEFYDPALTLHGVLPGGNEMKLSEKMNSIAPSDIRKWTSVVEKVRGINLAQGNCFIEPQPEFPTLVGATVEAMMKGCDYGGYNTYAHASGVDALREAIAIKAQEFNGIAADPDLLDGNIVVTHGATGAMACALDAVVDPGDEVILFEPFYNYHLKSLAMRSGVPRFVKLAAPDWKFDHDAIEAEIGPRTKALIVNTPCNPNGKVFTRTELQAIADVCEKHDLVAITDEVYEFIVFDGAEHISLASLPGMSQRTITISSFSKTMAITGWRVGYAIAPGPLAQRIRVANEMNYVCAAAPLQHALAPQVRNWRQFTRLAEVFERKREILFTALEEAGFTVHRPHGAYYMLADFSDFGFLDDMTAVTEMINRIGVGAVPGTAFFTGGEGKTQLRFCFAFRDEGLRQAGERLRRLRRTT
jgi:aminotransferase